MLKVILDTNCLLAAAPRRSKYHWLYEMLKYGEVRLAVTTDILEEYEEQLSEFLFASFRETHARS